MGGFEAMQSKRSREEQQAWGRALALASKAGRHSGGRDVGWRGSGRQRSGGGQQSWGSEQGRGAA